MTSALTTATPAPSLAGSSLAGDVLSPGALAAADPSEVARLLGTLDVASPVSIMAFGRDVADRTASYADTLLETARTTDLDGVGTQLNAIVVAAKGFNLASYDSRWTHAPVVGGLIRKLAIGKSKMMSRFASVKEQVDGLVAEVERTTKTLEKRSSDFQAMYDGVRAEHDSLNNHVAAIETCLEHVDAELAAGGDPVGDMDAAERVAVLKSSRAALAKRAADLRVLQHSALQTLPMVRVMQANNVALIDKFHVVRNLTLPAWKRAFLMALTLEEQKGAADLANSIDDATNAFMKRNADLLHENAVATAKANQRLVVDVETLRHVHDKVLETLSDVRAAHDDGARKRENLAGELSALREEMASGYRRIAAPAGARQA